MISSNLSSVFFYLLKMILLSLVGTLILLLIFYVLSVRQRPDLAIWHTVKLDQEYSQFSRIKTFEQYLELEDRLFNELDEKVYQQIKDKDKVKTNRYNLGSLSDPNRWPINYNRSLVLEQENPKSAVLMLHGMSDSPYSMHHLAESLHENGAYVLALRMPGHGTAPSSLTRTNKSDMTSAVRLAMNHIRDKYPNVPIKIVGYSNGGALAIHYALSTYINHTLPKVSGVVLFSPAIGVSKAAAFAVWQSRLARWLGIEKLAWFTVNPEYDPFKYSSFSINASDIVYRLTSRIRTLFKIVEKTSSLDDFPPILAFQSSVDSTVSTKALINDIFERLPRNNHHLILYDVNRTNEVVDIINKDPAIEFGKLLSDKVSLPFDLSVYTNKELDTLDVKILHKSMDSLEVETTQTDLKWPKNVYSLSHIALPFPKNDPLYGPSTDPDSNDLHLGDMNFRGERNVLRIDAADMLRQRWNPFFSDVLERLQDFVFDEDKQ